MGRASPRAGRHLSIRFELVRDLIKPEGQSAFVRFASESICHPGSRGSAFAQGACCPNQKERGPVARSNLISAETSEIFPSLGKSDIAAAHRAALRHLGNTPTRLRRDRLLARPTSRLFDAIFLSRGRSCSKATPQKVPLAKRQSCTRVRAESQ